MSSIRHGILIAVIVLSLVGCAGLTQMQDSVTKFDQGAHSASVAEMNFLRAVQAADCNYQFYTQAADWAQGKSSRYVIVGPCKFSVLDDKELKVRQDLMDAITLYTDKMAALASSDDNKTLTSNSQTLAENLNKIAKQGSFSNLSIATEVEAAIIAITEMALDQRRFTEVRKAASDMALHLNVTVEALKAENANYALVIAGKLGGIEVTLRSILDSAHKARGPMSFFDVIEARGIEQSANPLGATATSTASGATPQGIASQLNDALDAIVKANDAIAHASTGGIIATVNDLVARAQAAVAIQAALSK